MNPPTRIGRYEIIRRLSKSMTEVYLATDTLENRKVALKLIAHGDDRAMQLIVEAERRGAAIQKELHHLDPRMVEIYEYGDTRRLLLRRHGVHRRAHRGGRPGVGSRGGSVPRGRDLARNLRTTVQVPLLGVGGGARRHQALQHPPQLRRHGAAAGFRNRQDAARGLQRHRAPFRQPELLLAGTPDARRSGSAFRSVGAGRDALRNAGRRAALPGRRYAQAGGADPIQAAASRAAGLVPGRLARHCHEVAGAGRRQAVPVGRRIPAGPAAFSGAEADAGGDRSGGRDGIRPRPWRRRAKPFVASRVRRGANRGAACRSWAPRRTSLPECCFGSQARSAGSFGRHAPARRPAPR